MRAFAVFTRLFPFVLAFLRDRKRFLLIGRPRRVSADAHRERARRLTMTLAELGPTFIKLAQVFASRADILPEPYLSEIGALTDRVPPISLSEVETVIAREYGRPSHELFTCLEPEPLAAASLGQVHRARIDERDVVVKVLRPGVEELVATDLDAAFRVLFFINVLFPNHHVRAITTIVREFAKRIEEEMDFREEARNAGMIRANFASDPRVRIPEIVEPYTRRRVLVLEFMEGTKIDRLQARITSGEVSLDGLIETIIEVYVQMMLVDGVFHADPHPGNLLVDPEGRLVLLDFGMVIRVEQETRARLIATVMSAVRQDVDGVIAGFYELGLLDPEVDRGTVRDAARAIMKVAFTPDAKPRQIQRIVNEVLDTFYRWPIMLPSELVYFGRAAALVEGIGFRYDPDFNGVHFAAPIVRKLRPALMRTMFGADGREAVQNWVNELTVAARELRDVLRRAGRDELRVRAHPRDVLDMQQFVMRQTRRVLLAAFACVVAVVGALTYIVHQNLLILGGSLAASLFFFLVIFFLPPHLLSNPFRGVRRWR